jgi:hypothetical protein
LRFLLYDSYEWDRATDDPRIKELMDWENEEETLAWLDSL